MSSHFTDEKLRKSHAIDPSRDSAPALTCHTTGHYCPLNEDWHEEGTEKQRAREETGEGRRECVPADLHVQMLPQSGPPTFPVSSPLVNEQP